jgi:hypothetical protein
MAASVAIRSAQDGTTLTLRDVTEYRFRDSEGPEYLEVEVSGPKLSARRRVYALLAGGI